MVRVFICVFLIASAGFAAVDTSRDSPSEMAVSLARKAARAEKTGDFAKAYVLYSEAAALDPGSRRYKSRMELLQTAATRQSRPSVISAAPVEHPVLTPEQVFDSMTERELANARELAGVPRLAAKPGVQDFSLTGDARTLFQKVAESFGLDPVFDADYPPGGAPVVFRVTGADYREALNDLQAATGSFVTPLSRRVFIVAKDVPNKRNDLEQTMAIGIPIPQSVTTQELTELSQVVRQVTNVEKIAWDTAQSRIVIKDRVSRVVPAVEILQQLMSYRAEVMIDMEFIQVSSSDVVNYGFNVTNTFPVVYLGHVLNNMLAFPTGITNLLTFGGGKTLFGIAAAQVQAMFNQTVNTSDSMFRAQVRSTAGQPATLHVGDKYPVITGGYIGSGVTGLPPVFTYEDLGLEMKVTPFVHGMNEVTLNIETSFEVLTGQSINDIPVIGRRSMSSFARLREGEWAVVGGLMGTTHSKNVKGFWGLSQIPLIGNLFQQTSKDTEDSTVLIGLRPHLLSLPPDQILTRALRAGSELHAYIPL